MSTRVVVLGVDAANSGLVREWAAAGVLPTLQRLFARGLVGETTSVPGLFVGSTWPSFYTGVTPARHGVHGLVQLSPGTYDFYRRAPGEFVKRRPFWERVSDAGRKVAILDVPLTTASKALNGIQMVEWGSHDAVHGFHTWPPSLASRVKRRFGLHPLRTGCDAPNRSPAAFTELTQLLLEGVRKKAELTGHFLARDRWDLFVQVFTEAHCVGHQCWHLHDPNHPGHPAELVAGAADPVREVYVAIDQAIGKCLADVNDEAVVLVLIGHGMSHRYDFEFLMPDILTALGVMAPVPSLRDSMEGNATSGVDTARSWWQTHVPYAVRRRVHRAWRRSRAVFVRRPQPVARSFDPARSKCFMTYTGPEFTGLRLNVAGREPFGLLQPGPDTDAFCSELAGDLSSIVDLDNGKPIVERVVRTADLYRGDYLDHLPDLLVEWSDHGPRSNAAARRPGGSRVRVGSPKIGTLEGVNLHNRTGEHRADGLFVACGPGISPGRMTRIVSIMDFAPTLARLLDVDLQDVDGQPISELLQARGRVPD